MKKIIVYSLFAYIIFLLFYFLLKRNDILVSAKSGVEFCINALIPAIYPFMVISKIFVKLDICVLVGGLLSKLFGRILRFSKCGYCVIAVGMVCGYPVGTAMAKDMYKSGDISREEAGGLVEITSNFSPSFLIGFAGAYVFDSFAYGIYIYLSNTIASLLFAFVRQSYYKTDYRNENINSNINELGVRKVVSASLSAVMDSILSVLNISAFTIISFVFYKMILSFCKNAYLDALISLALELVNGLLVSKDIIFSTFPDKLSFCFCSFFCSFSGICSIAQTLLVCCETDIKTRYLMLAKLYQATIAFFVAYILFSLFL